MEVERPDLVIRSSLLKRRTLVVVSCRQDNHILGFFLKYAVDRVFVADENGVRKRPQDNGWDKRVILDINKIGTDQLFRCQRSHVSNLRVWTFTCRGPTEAATRSNIERSIKLVLFFAALFWVVDARPSTTSACKRLNEARKLKTGVSDEDTVRIQPFVAVDEYISGRSIWCLQCIESNPFAYTD